MADSRKPRYNGPLVGLDNPEPEKPVTRAGVDLTQFLAVLTDSKQAKDNGSPTPGRGFTIPAEAVSLYDSRFRTAATQLGIGVSIDVIEHGSARAANYGLTPGQVRLIVEAREKKARPGAAKASTNGASAAPAKAQGLPKPAGKK